MEQYTALYRKLRPVRFDEMVGQSHISRIMVNALTLGRVSHAYLFSGPRGTGKTSTAKILARAVNCLQPDGAEPCNSCAACERIGSGRSLDVMEIDGASNRGIDEIRDLREKVRLSPAEEKYKVYIIDEVHMLTGEAFNALLKTLEEPPARVLFVLATTEPHKVPETILSRCLRFDFRRISQAEIRQYLKKVAESQNVDIQEEALSLIAKMARGGLRDALSIFEQCMAFNRDVICLEDVEAVLGKAGDSVVAGLFDCISTCDVAGSLGIIEECVARGSDTGSIFNDILEYLRNMLILASAKDAVHLVPYGDDIIREMGIQSGRFSRDQLFEMADIAAGYARQLRWTNQPQVILELAVIKLCEFGTPETGEQMAKSKGESGTGDKSLSEKLSEKQAGYSGESLPAAAPPTLPFDPSRNETAAAAEPVETVESSAGFGRPEPLTEAEPPGPSAKSGHSTRADSSRPQETPSSGQRKSPEPVEEPWKEAAGTEDTSLSFQDLKKDWNKLMKKLKKEMISLHALMVEGVPVDFKGNLLTVSFDSKFKFHKETVEQVKNKKQLEAFLGQNLGRNITLKFVLEKKAQTAGGKDNQDLPGVNNKQDIVNKAMEIFGGELIPVEDLDFGDGSQNEEGY